MTATTVSGAENPGTTRRLRRYLWGLGALGSLSLLLAPMEQLAPGLRLSPLAIRMLALINPVVLTVAAVAIGCWTGPRVGLDAPVLRAWLEGRPVGPIARRQARPTFAVGIACALILFVFAAVSRPLFAGTPAASFAMPLPTKLLYGGIVEELLLRWGAMSLVAWLIVRALGRAAAGAMLAAIVLTAALFAIGHLPALAALAPEASPALVSAALVGNFVPGLLFGWLFWRRGLEAAMAAHALAHLFATMAG